MKRVYPSQGGEGVNEPIHENAFEILKYHADKTFYLLLLSYSQTLDTK